MMCATRRRAECVVAVGPVLDVLPAKHVRPSTSLARPSMVASGRGSCAGRLGTPSCMGCASLWA
eukprot:scaffold283800_cov30-Tisochrysis_lutea.AAC.4